MYSRKFGYLNGVLVIERRNMIPPLPVLTPSPYIDAGVSAEYTRYVGGMVLDSVYSNAWNEDQRKLSATII